MRLPPWLPPLNTDHEYSVHISAKQRPPSDSYGRFQIIPKVEIMYSCQDPVFSKTQLKSVSISHDPFHPSHSSFYISKPASKKNVADMLHCMWIPFSYDKVHWKFSRLDCSKSSRESIENDAESCILKYLVATKERKIPEDICVELTITKKVYVPKEEFQEWLNLYNDCKAQSSDFEYNYLKAIRIFPCTKEFYKALSVRSQHPSIGNIIRGVEFRAGDLEEDCSICLEKITLGSRVTRLPCHHMYHGDCIREWLKNSRVCPLCRTDLLIFFYLGW